MITYSAAMSEVLHLQAIEHLVRTDRQEDLCFALWYPSEGSTRRSALVRKLILPEAGDRIVHGNASFTAQYFERALFNAVRENAGLVFMHSHIGPGWQDMSRPDIRAELGHAAATKGATGLPLVGMTVGTDGAWSARFWEKAAPNTYERKWCTHVRVVGDGLTVTYNESLMPVPAFTEELTRTVSAWGEAAQANVARTHVGVVGLGSVGQIVAESGARTGIVRMTAIDYDRFEYLNLDRSLHAKRTHAKSHAPKVHVVAEALRESATARDFSVLPVQASVVDEDAFRRALDCDILISCVDRPWARSVLNFIAYAHLIPVVDGGIRVNTGPRGTLTAADWKAHTVGPGRRCLACIGQYDPAFVAVERDGLLDDPSYIQGLPKDHILRRNENVFAFSVNTGGLQFLQMLAMVISPLGISNQGEQMYHFVPGVMDEPLHAACAEHCPFPGLEAKGDRSEIKVTGRDRRAEAMRGDALASIR